MTTVGENLAAREITKKTVKLIKDGIVGTTMKLAAIRISVRPCGTHFELTFCSGTGIHMSEELKSDIRAFIQQVLKQSITPILATCVKWRIFRIRTCSRQDDPRKYSWLIEERSR